MKIIMNKATKKVDAILDYRYHIKEYLNILFVNPISTALTVVHSYITFYPEFYSLQKHLDIFIDPFVFRFSLIILQYFQ